MTHVLVIVQRPDKATSTASSRWREFLDSAEAIAKKHPEVKTIASGVWMIHLQDSLHIATELCSEVRRLGLRYEALWCGALPRELHLAFDHLA